MAKETLKLLIVPRLAANIEAKLQTLVPRPSLVIKPAWYLAQMHIAALEYNFIVRKLATSPADSAEAVFDNIKRLREIAKTLRHYAIPFALACELLEAYIPKSTTTDKQRGREIKRESSTSGSSNDLAGLHRRYYKSLCERLQRIGCSKITSTRFADDVLDLLWELRAFLSKTQWLVGGRKVSTVNLVSLLEHIADQWSSTNWHAKYHLGEYEDEDADLYNPGVLGWSLAILSEIAPAVEQEVIKRLKRTRK